MRTQTLRRNLSKMLLTVMITVMATIQAFAQVTVTGTIKDQTGEPIAGATVLVKGTSNGASTDLDGKFTIQNVKSDQVLSISFIGYASQEISVGNQTVFDIQLKEDSELLEDVVVVGYGVQKKSNLTGAISQVKSGDIQNRTSTDVNQSMQGKTAGVQLISTSGTPGAESTIRVRGFSSNSTSNPLYVVDGVRVNSIANIDPNDVESMEILKDAASAAIYGAEAGNGVVMITTKRGKAGQGKISYSGQWAIQTLGRKPKVMNAREYLDYQKGIGNDYTTLWDGTDTDWTEAMFENALMQKHSINLQNGYEKGNFYVSFNYTNNDGMMKGDKDFFQRFAGNINGEYEVKPWLQVSTQNVVSYISQGSLAENSQYFNALRGALAMDPLTKPVYAPNNLPQDMQNLLNSGTELMKDGDGNYYGISRFQNGDDINPLIAMAARTTKTWSTIIQGNTAVNLKPFKGFVFTSRLGYRFASSNNSIYNAAYYGSGNKHEDQPDIDFLQTHVRYYQWENFANYNTTIAKKHDLGAMIGISYSAERKATVETGGRGLQKDDELYAYPDYLSGNATNLIHAGDDFETKKYSYFGRLSYSYAGRYMVQFTMRADAADLSILPDAQRWGYFPAVSAGWTVSQEKWFPQDQNYVTNLKIRASWGQNGSIAGLTNFAYGNAMASSIGTSFSAKDKNYVNATLPSSTGNQNLKWETSEQTDLGIDASFFSSRLTLGVDYYIKKTKDLLVTNTIPTLTIGNTVSPVNAGNVENKGWEFDLGWKDQVGGFTYGISANLSTLKNEVTYLDPSITRINGFSTGASTVFTAFEKGQPVWYFRGYNIDHINPENGKPVYVDAKGGLTETPTSEDVQKIGSPIPSVMYGMTLNFGYKNFDLTIFGQGTAGNNIYSYFAKADRPETNRLACYYNDAWKTPGQSAKYASLEYQHNNASTYFYSNTQVFDGSYFKIKQIQLGYNLPKSILSKARIENLRIYCSLDDFFLFTSYPGLDPEASSGDTKQLGIDLGSFPNSKKVVFGLNLTF